MIARLSKNISSFFIFHGIVSEGNREIYDYSFEILLSTIISLATLGIIAVLSKTVLYTTLFLLGFVPLRLIAGGYHAKTHFRCFMVMMLAYTMFQVLLSYLPADYRIPIILITTLVSALLVLLFAPSEDKNRPVSNEEIVRFKKINRVVISAYTVGIFLTTAFISDERYVLSLAMGVFTVGVSLLANQVKKWRTSTNNAESRRGA